MQKVNDTRGRREGGETVTTEPTNILHRACMAYMDWTGVGTIYVCRECGGTLDLSDDDSDDDDGE